MFGKVKSKGDSHRTMGCLLTLFPLLLLGISIAFAQLPTATILGVVKDASGAVVPDAALTARNVDTGQTRTAVTSGDGSYRFSALPVGNYEVRSEHPGFKSEVRSGLTLTVAQEAVVNFTLELGAIEQTVAVTAEAPLVNTTSGSLGGLVNEQKVASLPLNGRNYIDLTLLQPGVEQHRYKTPNAGANGTYFSSNGAPLRSNNYLLDGAPLVNMLGGTSASVSGSTLGVEGIREYRLVTNSSSAEYGMSMGSQMVIVSKSGTNNFHGSLFEFLRNSALDARNFFDYRTKTNPRRLPEFQRNNFGGSFGGPIKKDKTFFFAVYEGVREGLGITTVDNVIAPSAKLDGGPVPQIAPVIKPLLTLFPDPNLPNNQFTFPSSQRTRDDYGQIRVDQNFSAKDSLFGRYTIQDTNQTRPMAYPKITFVGTSRGQFATLAEDHIFSPTLLNTSRLSFSRSPTFTDAGSNTIGPQFSFIPGLDIGTIMIGGITTFDTGSSNPTGKKQNIFTWSDDLFYTRGRHSLKMGTLINHFQQWLLLANANRGVVTFPNLTSFLLAQPSTYTALTPGSIIDRTWHYNTLGFYVQDDLRVISNLTLNLGLRYEFATQINETHGHGVALRDMQHDAETTIGIPFKNNSLKNFSPRFGFAWDVMRNGKTAVRGGFALLYDLPTNLGNSLNALNTGTPPFSSQTTVQNPPTFTIPLLLPPGRGSVALRLMDYNLQQPHILQYNLTLERQLPFGMAASLAYAGSRGINLLQVKDGNPTVPQILPDGREFWPANAPRTNPNWNNVELHAAAGNSWYNSFQFGLTKRLSKGLQFQSSYTWSKLIDETQGQANGDSNADSVFGSDPSHRQVDRGLADFDVPHLWHFNAIYNLPQRTSAGGVLGKVLNGWWISNILTVQSGAPFTPALQANRSRSLVNGGVAGIDRPDLVAGRSMDSIILGGPDRYYDPTAFRVPALGFLGTAGRSILLGPGFATLDFSVVKDTSLGFLGEGGKLELRAEFFNILNHANFAAPDRTVYAARADVESPLATAGRISTTLSSSRQIQLALKLLF